ncbi:MAG: hypothetical protein AAGK14_08850 [Verrucomicrobiota bacterium]
MSEAATMPTANPAWPVRLRHPGDLFSPMLVKDIRQGMRTRMFLAAFLILQGALMCALAKQMVEMKSMTLAEQSQFFWIVLGVMFCLVMPARGLTSISSERGHDTLELLQLTGLTAWQIVCGKWLALVLQSLLLAITVLPYVIVRYFLGATEVVQEVMLLTSLLAGSGIMTAGCIMISAFRNWMIRILLGGLILIALLSGLGNWATTGAVATEIPFNFLVWIIGEGAILIAVLFEMTASRLENEQQTYTRRKQILIVVLIVGGIALGSYGYILNALGLTIGATSVSPVSLIIPFVISLIGLGIATAHQTPIHESKLMPVPESPIERGAAPPVPPVIPQYVEPASPSASADASAPPVPPTPPAGPPPDKS